MAELTLDEIWGILDKVKDPEIPVISIVEMGIVREVKVDGSNATVILAPTFVGCPALSIIHDEVVLALSEAGFREIEVRFTYSPPWSSDDLTTQARQKMKDFGLAPPPRHQGLIEGSLLLPVPCPYCNSTNTSRKNMFGPTLCRAIYFCNDCNQPFEQFKPI